MACNEENDPDSFSKKATIVRIITTIDLSSNGTPAVRGGAVTRLGGMVDESNSDYEEGKEDGNQNENSVATIRLFAFDPITGSATKNILFHAPGATPADNEKNFAFADGTSTHIYLDMEIMSGNYRFVLVANEETSWNLASITTYAQLTSSESLNDFENPITTETTLAGKVAGRSGIPMIGEAAIRVEPNANATPENPQIITDPVIELKRTIAKVEVFIKNTDEDGTVFETAEVYRIKSVELLNAWQRYNVFEGNSNSITPHSWTAPITVGHTEGAVINDKILTNYIAESKGVDEADATIVRIVTEANGTEYTYNIPLFQYEDASKTEKNYDIHRNTIYRIGTILKGQELDIEITVNYEIVAYQTIEIKYNHPGIVNVDRAIFGIDNGAGFLYFNFKSYDIDATAYMEYFKTTVGSIDGEVVPEAEIVVEEIESGLFKYTLKNISSYSGEKLYLHFRNTTITGEKNIMSIGVTVP